MFDSLGSDIVVMQELKIQRKDLRDDMVLLDGWDCYFSLPKHKKGYSGVGIYTRNATCAPIKAEEGLLGVLPSPSGVPYCELPETESIGGYPSLDRVTELGVDAAALDAEGRCLVLEFPAFVLLGVYSPANSNGLRDDFRYGFICALDCRIRNLIKNGKRVVLVGDLNVSRDERDTASAVEDVRKAGLTHEDYISTPNRRIFNQLLIGGEVVGERDEGREDGVLWDTTRGFHPDRIGMYTHWEQKINARPGNYGSRIDFVLVSGSMQSWVKAANIQEGLLGSDHCPVFADFHETVAVQDREEHLVDNMNPPGTFRHAVRRLDWKLQNVPAFSAKRLPEFDKRRSIKSMFTVPALKHSPSSSVPDLKSDSTWTATDRASLTSAPENEPQSRKPSTATQISASDTVRPSPPKRKIVSSTKEKASKRQKLDAQTATAKGQQSLKGFFQKEKDQTTRANPNGLTPPSPQTTTQGRTDAAQPLHTSANGHNGSQQNPNIESDVAENEAASTPSHDAELPAESAEISPSSFTTRLAATEQNQKSWNSLFSRPVAPMCESHNEPCKTMLTKKKGSNQGRSFWMCARPLGPSGAKERGTQWRCATFIWCSDWGGRKEDGRPSEVERNGDG